MELFFILLFKLPLRLGHEVGQAIERPGAHNTIPIIFDSRSHLAQIKTDDGFALCDQRFNEIKYLFKL